MPGRVLFWIYIFTRHCARRNDEEKMSIFGAIVVFVITCGILFYELKWGGLG